MDVSLLATKVQIPSLTHLLVRRQRLISAIERGVQHHRITVITAPAGYGKTTLLADWARASDLSIAWVSLDEEDNSIERFLRYTFWAWERIDSDIADSRLAVLLGAMEPDIEAVLTEVINSANRSSAQTVLVFDDIHLLDEPAILEALSFLVDHLPPTLHLVLSGRSDPAIPLARYRARSQLSEIRAADLAFLPDESEEFVLEKAGIDLDRNQVAQVASELEGWIAGLQLVSLTLKDRNEPDSELRVSGDHKFIADYLAEDVLSAQPDEVRRFLLHTGVLDRLSAPICDAVMEGEDCQAMLEYLHDENLFVESLDDSRRWFRYHRIFADFLRRRLKRDHPGEFAKTHRRAARWNLEQGFHRSAFNHALQGNDAELGAETAEHYFETALLSGEYSDLHTSLEAVPPNWREEHSVFGLFEAGAFLFTGRLAEGMRCIEEVEKQLSVGDIVAGQQDQARATAIRCAVACFQNDLPLAEEYADRAFEDLREDDHTFLSAIHHALGDTYRRNGMWDEARQHYVLVLTLENEPAFPIRSAHAYCALADLELMRGKLRASEGYWRLALAAIQNRENWGRFPLPLLGWVYIRLGGIEYELNNLEAARGLLADGIERAEAGGDIRGMISGYLIAGRVELTAGNDELASEYLELARPLVTEASFVDLSGQCDRLQLEIWLAKDQLRAAVNWADAVLSDDAYESFDDDYAKLALARLLIVKGDQTSLVEASRLLDRVIQTVGDSQRADIRIEGDALRALAHAKLNDPDAALIHLESALRLAEPELYLRIFADLGLPMFTLLHEATSLNIMPEYVATLLATFGDHATSRVSDNTLLDPLTEREQEILELISTGLTNAAIADALYISPQTVKKHAGNIYGKLSVHTRTEAAARARDLGLLH